MSGRDGGLGVLLRGMPSEDLGRNAVRGLEVGERDFSGGQDTVGGDERGESGCGGCRGVDVTHGWSCGVLVGVGVRSGPVGSWRTVSLLLLSPSLAFLMCFGSGDGWVID